MKKYLLSYLLVVFFSCCTNQQKNEATNVKEAIPSDKEKKDIIIVKDSLFFNDEDKIIEISHLENDVKQGFSLIFDEKTNIPKYLVEYNEGKRDKIIITFHNDGKIKSFRTGDISNNSQKMQFHENGVIKSIGNTVEGKGDGKWYYFDKAGKLVKEVMQKEGQITD